MSPAEIDPFQFRQLLGRFATGVTILTLATPEGRPLGMTANSLASVSLQPPLLSVCVDREAEMHDVILEAPEFVVNVLASPQEALARRFSDKHEDRFDGVGYHLSSEGLILLDSVLAHIVCERHATYPAGDHTIVLGRVVGGATSDERPLLFYRGGYAALG
ncbi:MAG TPA: flavin reductase family protein [Gemmatimonadales bacterium]|nr:flavin reductase family protein [Gemmatimonadales bacterium]